MRLLITNTYGRGHRFDKEGVGERMGEGLCLPYILLFMYIDVQRHTVYTIDIIMNVSLFICSLCELGPIMISL